MATRRTARMAQAIRESVSTAILFELRDPRIQNVTVLDVEVAPDMRSAKVVVSVRGPDKAQTLSLKGLKAAAGFLQSRIASRLETRYTPVLSFQLEEKESSNAVEAARILAELEAERQAANGSAGLNDGDAIDEAAEATTHDDDADSE